MYFVRATLPEGILWLGRGKLGSASMAAAYAHPSAANTAAVNMNKKMVKKGLAPYDFDIMPTKDGIPVKESDPFRIAAHEPTPVNSQEIHVLADLPDVRIIRIHAKYEVVKVLGRFYEKRDALDFVCDLDSDGGSV